jgi:cobalt/nickel transport system permease protein
VTRVAGLLDFRRLDLLATGDSSLHRLDPRAKVIVTLVFIICAMSFDRYAVASLIPFAVFPIAVIAAARLPIAFLAQKLALVLPVALLIALPNPWFDREVLLRLGRL